MSDGVDPSDEVVALFRGCATSHVSDALGRLPGTTHLRPMHRGGALLGRALTVRVRSGDNLIIHRALRRLRPGHVLVVAGDGDTSRALVGEIMKRVAEARGCVGFVVDGAIRDLDAFARDDFPCFARAVTHRGPYKNGPGEVDVPIAVDGVIVNPGDVVLGDGDGVVVVPPAVASRVAAAARDVARREAGILRSIAEGEYDDRWIDATLAEPAGREPGTR